MKTIYLTGLFILLCFVQQASGKTWSVKFWDYNHHTPESLEIINANCVNSKIVFEEGERYINLKKGGLDPIDIQQLDDFRLIENTIWQGDRFCKISGKKNLTNICFLFKQSGQTDPYILICPKSGEFLEFFESLNASINKWSNRISGPKKVVLDEIYKFMNNHPFFLSHFGHNYRKVNYMLPDKEDRYIGEETLSILLELRELGRGAFAVTYEVRNDWKNSPEKSPRYALKIADVDKTDPNEMSDRERKQIFSIYNEARILSSLRGISGVINFHDAGVHEGKPFFYENMGRTTLSNYLQRNSGNFGPQRLYDVTLKILTTVDLLHELDIFHLDIKAENIIVDYDDEESFFRVNLVDFGVSYAKIFSHQLINWIDQGTPGYFKPTECEDTDCLITKFENVSIGVTIIYDMLFNTLRGGVWGNDKKYWVDEYNRFEDNRVWPISPPDRKIQPFEELLDGDEQTRQRYLPDELVLLTQIGIGLIKETMSIEDAIQRIQN